MMRTSGENSVHDAVVKSCSRVPIATTTSASAAMVLAEVEPMIPSGPAFSGCGVGSRVRPATVSTTGTPCAVASSSTAAAAPE